MRESIEVWIAPSSFEPELTLGNRIRNSLSITPKKLPRLINPELYKLYLRESIYILDSPYKKTSPEGTRQARPIEFERTWKNWFNDIKIHVEQGAAVNP